MATALVDVKSAAQDYRAKGPLSSHNLWSLGTFPTRSLWIPTFFPPLLEAGAVSSHSFKALTTGRFATKIISPLDCKFLENKDYLEILI